MPFRNLRFFIIFNKALGLISCKLVNGRLKSSNIWSYCLCIMWVLFYSIYVYMKCYEMLNMYQTAEAKKKEIVVSIVNFLIYFVSLLPYFFVSAFRSENFVKLSDKLLAYDEQAIALGHRREDKHIFMYIFFAYTSVGTSIRTYYSIIDDDNILQDIMKILNVFQRVTYDLVGSSSIFVTCIFLDLIRQRFHHLNEMIVPHVSQLPVTRSQNEITVYNVRYLHGILLDDAEQLNTLYGLATLFTFMSTLINFIWIMYTFIKDIQEDVPERCVEILILLFLTIYLFAMYHFTAYEANRVEERVIKYGLPFSNKKSRMDKIEMMLYFYHRRYSFTAADFFPLNLTILLPITTAIITYLILLI